MKEYTIRLDADTAEKLLVLTGFEESAVESERLAVTNDDTQIILSAEETAELSEFFYQEEFFRKYDPIYPKAFSLRGSFFIA